MNNVEEFIEVRQGIESRAKEIEVLLGRKTMAESRIRLDETMELLARLTSLADNDVQENAVKRLTHLLHRFEKKVVALVPEKGVVKEPTVS